MRFSFVVFMTVPVAICFNNTALSYPNDELTPVLKHCIIRTYKQNDLCAAVGTDLVSTTDIELIPAIAGKIPGRHRIINQHHR
jgi:hypothetical protein